MSLKYITDHLVPYGSKYEVLSHGMHVHSYNRGIIPLPRCLFEFSVHIPLASYTEALVKEDRGYVGPRIMLY